MKTQEILTIVALSSLGLCLLCGLAKMAMKNSKKRGDCDKACGALFFVAVALLAVGQLLGETHTTSGFEMDSSGRKPENCVMKASSMANEYEKGQMAKLAKARNNVMKKGKEIYNKELASCKAGGHSKPHHHKHHKHHKHHDGDTLVCYDGSTDNSDYFNDRGWTEMGGVGSGCWKPPAGVDPVAAVKGCQNLDNAVTVMTLKNCMNE